jgi:hypothetical protein
MTRPAAGSDTSQVVTDALKQVDDGLGVRVFA